MWRMRPTVVPDSWIPDGGSLGARLALVRHSMNWNLKQAANECRLAMNAWARYEQGIQPRDLLGTVDKIVARTGVDRMWLLTGDAPPETRKSPHPDGPDGGQTLGANLRPIHYKPMGSRRARWFGRIDRSAA